jgi:hypothetical protein
LKEFLEADMPVDFNSTPETDPTRVESDTPMFAPIRTSKRGQKGGFFSDHEPEPGAAPAADTPATATPATGQRLDEPADGAFATGPTFADGRTSGKRNSMLAPMAIVGGLVLLAGVGVAGWYATQPHDNGIAQITPSNSDISVTPVAPPADQLAQAPAPEPAAAPPASAPPANAKLSATARAEPAPRPARARAATSRAAEDQGVNASAVVPAPVRSLNPAPVAPPVNPSPPQAAPAPAPTPVTPQPSDTPTQQTAPPQQSPTTPPTQTPPQ